MQGHGPPHMVPYPLKARRCGWVLILIHMIHVLQHGFGLLLPKHGWSRNSYIPSVAATSSKRPQGGSQYAFIEGSEKGHGHVLRSWTELKAPGLIGHSFKVIIVTHNYGRRAGIRYLTSGVKVYHVPHWLVYDQVSLPTVYSFFPLFRYIVVRERIDVVHGHGVRYRYRNSFDHADASVPNSFAT